MVTLVLVKLETAEEDWVCGLRCFLKENLI